MSSPTDLPANFFELLRKCQGLALKLLVNPECKAMFHPGLESMYHVTAESQGLSWELKVAAQEHQNLFLQELEGPLIAPPPPPPAPPQPGASRRHTGHKRKGTASANPPISIPSAQHMLFQAQVRKIHQYPNQIQIEKNAILHFSSSTRGGNSPIPLHLSLCLLGC